MVIPTLNEGAYLARTIEAVRAKTALGTTPDIVVADCGSRDGTPEIAARLGIRVVTEDPPLASRAAALNAGARSARGADALLFLHADTIPPSAFDRHVLEALARGGVVGGAFEFSLEGRGLGLRAVEAVNRIRYTLWRIFFGDQGIFVRSDVFRAVGGFPDRKILEDSEFCRVLARRGRLALLPHPMRTSPRRFLEGGVGRVLARDAWIWALDLLELPTERFAASYRRNNVEREFRGFRGDR